MKTIRILLVLTSIFVLISCGRGVSKAPANADGFTALQDELKKEFGGKAYYTNVTVVYNKSIGNTMNVTVTGAPESLKMEEWNFVQDAWKQSSDISIEIPKGTKASDFMFQLNDKINLTQLGTLVEKSSKTLTKDKNIEIPVLAIAFIKFPKSGDVSKTEYSINLEPENGGTTFSFNYTLNGELIKMDY